MNLATWVERHGRRRPDEPALATGTQVHADWATFAAHTAAVGAGLSGEFGLDQGDRVAIFMSNRPEYLEVWAGLAKLGITTALVNTQLVGDALGLD